MIHVAEPDINKDDILAVANVMNSNWISGTSPKVSEFEQKFAKYHNCKYGVATGSGSTALHLALVVLGVGKGDEVIIPDFTMVACANAVSYLGAKPVFVDANVDTWCMEDTLIEKAITKKTKAIMPVHIYGHPCNMKYLEDLKEDHDIKIVEDCAEAHGAEYNGRKVGSFGDCGVFSFYANKIITTGEGGLLITNDEALAEKAQWYKAHCFGRGGKHFWHDKIGFGYRMSGLQATLGISQLERIDNYVEQRRSRAKMYMNMLAGLAHVGKIKFPVQKRLVKNVYWMFSILVNPEKFGMTRDKLMIKLANDGIETRTMFYPMHIQPSYKTTEKFPVADFLCKNGLNLPSGNNLTQFQVNKICERIRYYGKEIDDIQKKTEEMKKVKVALQ